MISRVDAPTGGDIVQDAREAMIARRGSRFDKPATDATAEPARDDAEEGEVERAQREALERRAKRFA